MESLEEEDEERFRKVSFDFRLEHSQSSENLELTLALFYAH